MKYKQLKRTSINALLLIGAFLALYLTIQAYHSGQWETIAATLAVITAILSLWISQKIVWKQEDDLEPDIILYFDLDSRDNVIQLVIKNIGGSNAYDIKLYWITSLHDSFNTVVNFPYIPVLQKNDLYRVFVDLSSQSKLNISFSCTSISL